MGWLSDWSYRKAITLSRASGAVSNYQMKLLVGESSGATGEDVDCGGNVLSSFDDLRFTTSDGETLLDYWIESISGVSPNQLATVWIEFNSIGTGATTFYMYYGNAGAAAYSNGDDTFIFFDHFDGSFPGTKWSGDTGYGGVASSILTFQNGGLSFRQIFSSPNSGQSTFAVRARAQLPKAAGEYATIGARKSDSTHSSLIYSDNNVTELYSKDATTESVAASNWTSGSYKIWDILVEANTDMTVLENGSGVTGSPKSTNPANSSAMSAQVGIYNVNAVLCDWILLRNWNPTEPVWGAWGSEEVAWTQNLSDSFSLADAISKGVDEVQSDGLSLSDAITKGITFLQADSITLSDLLIRGLIKELSDTISLADSVFKSVAISKTDIISLVDLVSKAFGMPRDDAMILVDAIIKSFSHPESDGIFLSDLLLKDLQAGPPDCAYQPINIGRPILTDGPLAYSHIQKEESVGQEGPLTYEFLHDASHPGIPKDWFYSRWFEEGWFDPEVAEDFSFKILEHTAVIEENNDFSYKRL